MTAGRHFDFGPFRLDTANHELLRDGRAVPLKPKAFDLLRVLVENRGRIVSKDDLLRRVWPDAAVEESSLTQNIYELRKALSGADRDLRYIENVPKRGYRFAAEVSASGETASADSLSASGGDQKSIAVLPFRSLGATAGSEYLGVGIADTLITVLTNIRGIVVRPIAAVHAYANGPTDPLQLARTLEVDAVLDGSVQTASGRIRVTVRLLDVASGAALWAMKFDETETDIFAVQDTIAETVAAAVAPELGDRDRAALKKRYTVSTTAYELYLKGRYNWNKSSEESLWRAIEFFRAAIDADPDYALAYVGIADAYTSLDWYGILSTRESNPHALRAAERALAIDDSLAEAHASLAMAKQYAWEWAAAERAYREAIAEIRRAESLDPVSLSIGSQVALVYLCARRYEEGLVQARKVLAVDSSALEARFYLGMLLQLLGRADEAIAVYRELPSDNPDFRAMLASAYGTAGDLAAARRVLNELQALSKYVPPFWLAIARLGVNDVDGALDELERACSDPDDSLLAVKVFAVFDPLRTSPRYRGVLERMRLSSDDSSGG